MPDGKTIKQDNCGLDNVLNDFDRFNDPIEKDERNLPENLLKKLNELDKVT